MNVQIKWNGTDITTSVIEYSREQNICTGFGTVDMTVESVVARDFEPWDSIVIYEKGYKMGEYNIASAEEQIPGAIYVVSCQDDSKRLTDYFIDKTYEITSPSTAKYWIEKFLTEGGVSYSINATGNGSDLSENTSLGMTSLYDTLLQLLQMCGWYFYFDSDSVCQIGSLEVDGENVKSFYWDEILNIGYTKSDKMLRNRVVVWGAGDKDGNWIFADTSTTTAWNRPYGDYRTIVYANSAIKTFGIAYNLAATILAEFSQTLPEGNLQVIDSHSDISLGKRITGSTLKLSVSGMVTTLRVNMSSSGLTSTYTLDQRCPRLFGYADWNDWVYIGTLGTGVWRKHLKGATWYNYSTGITDLNIKDLSAYNGTLGCTTDGGEAYVRHTSLASWSEYKPAGFTNNFVVSGEGFGSAYLTSGILAEASSLDRNYGVTGALTFGFTIPNASGMAEFLVESGRRHDMFPASGNLSWIQEVTLGRLPVYTQQIVISSGYDTYIPSGVTDIYIPPPYDIGVVDLETNWDGINLISVFNGKKTWVVIPPYSGNIMPHLDWGDATGIKYNSFYNDSLAAFVSTAKSPSIITAVPPPNDGIALTTSGYYIVTANITAENYGFNGGFTFIDDIETEGRVYAYDSEKYEKYVFHLASGVGGEFWYNYMSYTINEPTSDPGNLKGEGWFYKTGENTFTLTAVDSAVESPDFPIYVYHCIGTADDNTQEVTLSNFSQTKICNNMMLDPDALLGIDRIYDGGKYAGVVYGSEDAGYFYAKFAVIELSTGIVTYNNLIAEADAARFLCGIPGGHGIHYVFGGIVLNNKVVDDSWGGFDISICFLEKHTGQVRIVTKNYTPKGPGTPKDRVTRFGVVSSEYTQGACSQACENPSTGVGYAHAVKALQHDRWVYSPDLWHTYYRVVSFINMTVNTPSFTKITLHTYEDIYQSLPPAYHEEFIGGDMPSWAKEGGWAKITTTCSRNISMTPGAMARMVGDNFHLVLVDPGDLETVTTFEKLYGYGYDGEREVINIYNMMDDYDNSIYAHVDVYPSGGNPITVGYTLGGTINKVFFPNTGKWGTPITDKMLIQQWVNGGTQKIHFYMPTTTISGREVSTSRYLVLNHDPKVLPSGSFTIIEEYTLPMYLDTAKNIPTVIYTKPDLDDYPSAFIARTFLNTEDDVVRRSPGGGMGIHDARVFDYTGNEFPENPGFLDRYIGVAGGHEGAVVYNAVLEPYENYTVIASGNINHIDFTNNDPSPYMFVSTSGVQNEGGSASGIFMQRDSESMFWTDYSSTLPSGIITIIRADDRM